MADRLGLPFMPWQRLVADVGGEIDPETGLPAYREVVFTVPRQSGKTTIVLPWEIQRAHGWDGPQRICYSAQDGNAARKKLVEDQFPLLEPRKARFAIRRLLRGVGSEAVDFANGSRIVLMASAEDSGHGRTIDMAVKDELFADVDDRRDQSLIPAMATKAAGQILTASTMGTDRSIPFNRLVARGRKAVEEGVRTGIAYFEWSAPLDADPDDPETWRACMPALGYTITEPVVRDARNRMTDGEFRRAFLNQLTKADDRVLPIAAWIAVCHEAAAPEGALTFSLDVNPERSAGVIVSASPGVAEQIAQREGTAWLVGRATELDKKWGPANWIVDSRGPAASLIGDMETAGLAVHATSSTELIQACGQFYDGVMGRTVAIRRSAQLDDAAAGAARRRVGDAWAWTRKSAGADISPLVAVTLALWGTALPPPVPMSTGFVDPNEYPDDGMDWED